MSIKNFWKFHREAQARFESLHLLRQLSGTDDVSHIHDQELLAGDPQHARDYALAENAEHNGRQVPGDEEDATDLG